MRTPRLLLLSACILLSGCSSSGVEALDSGSTITTASIVRPDVPLNAGAAPKAGRVSAEPAASRFASPQTPKESSRDAHEAELVALLNQPVPNRAQKAIIKHTVHKPKFADVKPIKFSVAEPKDYPVHGVDVSRWQGEIDWKTLKTQGANFAWIKATDGSDHLDPKFADNWRGAANAGIPRGAYHFFFWCSSASAQADWFIRNVPKVKGALPPVLDVEWNAHSKNCRTRPDAATVVAKMQVFLDKLERHYGQRPVIYTAPDFYADNLKGKFKGYTFWLRAVAQHPSEVYPGRPFGFWQYSGTGMSAGVTEKIDLNAFNGSKEAWNKWLKSNLR